MSKTKRLRLEARLRRVWRDIQRAFRGGTSFGIDAPTLCACEPELAAEFFALRKQLA